MGGSRVRRICVSEGVWDAMGSGRGTESCEME